MSIPDELCGIGGCAFLSGHEERGEPRHTWQTRPVESKEDPTC